MDKEKPKSIIGWIKSKLPGLCGYLIAVAGCLAFVYYFDKAVHVRPPDYGIGQFYRDFLGRMLGTQGGRYWLFLITLAVFGPYLFFAIIKFVWKMVKAPRRK